MVFHAFHVHCDIKWFIFEHLIQYHYCIVGYKNDYAVSLQAFTKAEKSSSSHF